MVDRPLSWRLCGVLCSISMLASGCGPAPKPAAASVPTPSAVSSSSLPATRTQVPEPARVVLRTGPLPPVPHDKIELAVRARVVDGAHELVELELPSYSELLDGGSGFGSSGPEHDMRWALSLVQVQPGTGTLAFAGPVETFAQLLEAWGAANQKRAAAAVKAKRPLANNPPLSEPVVHSVWIRRPLSNSPVEGTIYTAASATAAGHALPFSAKGNARGDRKTLERRWARALANWFGLNTTGYARFAEQRVLERYLGKAPAKPEFSTNAQRLTSALATLMDTTSGRLSLQAALEYNRELLVSARRSKASIPIAKVTGPALAHHDWKALEKALGKQGPEEPLARATPADFYFVRAREVGKLFDLIDELEEWGQPLADWMDGYQQSRDTFARYQTELGLARTGLASILGPRLVSELALVGSDPYLHEGTDITLIVRPKDPKLFSAALAAMLVTHRLAHGATTSSSFVHEGVTVGVERSADGRVRRHWASSAGLELVSNSPNAIRRVLSTLAGKAPALSNEPDFRYMLARDASTPNDVLGYAGDRFVESVVGPSQKIAETRRQVALAELSVPGYSALLAGTLAGGLPQTVDELLATKLLSRRELVHADGAPIAFVPGQGASSSFGSPAALEPLIDLPKVTQVSEIEQAGYREFAQRYEQMWSDRVDPIALRLRLEGEPAKKRTLVSDLRVLPLLRGQYREYLEMVGAARLVAPVLDSGARALFAIGADARLRRELSQTSRSFLGSKRLEFDWIGDYAGFGVDNRNEVLNLALTELSPELERPDPADPSRPHSAFSEAKLANFPIYGLVHVKSPIAVGLALTALREKIDQVVPGLAQWKPARTYRDATIVQVEVAPFTGLMSRPDPASPELPPRLSIYYALTPDAFVISLNAGVLERAIDRLIEQPVIASSDSQAANAPSSQFVLDLAAAAGSALSDLAALAFTEQALHTRTSTRAIADAVFAGDPPRSADAAAVRRLMRATFGSVVLTPEGQEYVASPQGARDPLRGTAHAPVWPAVPTRSSPLERLLTRLQRARTELAFDDEPGGAGLQSLHAKVTIELDPGR